MSQLRYNGSRSQVDPHLLHERVFHGIVAREQRRADRANRPLGLLLLEPSKDMGQLSASMRVAVQAAILATKSEADIAGWLQQDSQIGIILTDIASSDDLSTHCERIGVILRRELAARFRAAGIAPFSLRFRVRFEVPQESGIGQLSLATPRRPRRSHARRVMDDALKRGLDVVGSLTLLLLLMPVLVLIAGLVKWGSPGSAIFRQVRIGHMMRPFTMLKFRTMYSDADHTVHREFVSAFIKDQRDTDRSGPSGFFKLTNDSRVTPLGRILRKTSLDELPQLWNVLRGDLSLVGPRPPLAYELEQYQPWHRRRLLEAKPGITGLWQVAGRSRTTFDEMVRLDLRYAKTRSFWGDVKILLATPVAVISGKGAC